MKTVPFIGLFLVLFGCASTPSSKSEAISHTRPFITALKAYHHQFGDYPKELDELRPKFLAADILIYDNQDARHSWFLGYQRIDKNHYAIDLDSAPCSQAVFNNGTFVAGYGPNFK
jgi:hypothetical protein